MSARKLLALLWCTACGAQNPDEAEIRLDDPRLDRIAHEQHVQLSDDERDILGLLCEVDRATPTNSAAREEARMVRSLTGADSARYSRLMVLWISYRLETRCEPQMPVEGQGPTETLDRASIASVISGALSDSRKCGTDPSQLLLRVSVKVDRSGAVTSVRSHDSQTPAATQDCVYAAVKRLVFPHSRRGVSFAYSLPIRP
jgi:hypothetical protein